MRHCAPHFRSDVVFMRRHPQLPKVVSRATRRLDRLLMLAGLLNYPAQAQHDRLAAFLSIEALNCWNTFLREYYVAATVLGAKDAAGNRPFTYNLMSEDAAILEAIRFSNAGRFSFLQRKNKQPSWWDEPKWGRPNVFVSILRGTRFSNIQHIGLALTVSSDVFTSFPDIRNFFAHRTESTAGNVVQVAQRYGLPSSTRAADIMGFIPPSGVAKVGELWISDLKLAASQMA